MRQLFAGIEHDLRGRLARYRSTLMVLALAALVMRLVLLPAAGVETARADSEPSISGDVYGIEWCPQALCGSANFAGVFAGKAGRWPAAGAWSIRATHDPLPRETGESAAITGGSWSLATWRGKVSGSVSGLLTNNGDGTFTIDAVLELDDGGDGEIEVSAELDHNVFPPLINGDLE